MKSIKLGALAALAALGVLASGANHLWAAPLGSAPSHSASTAADAGATEGEVILVKRRAAGRIGSHRRVHPGKARPHRYSRKFHHRPRHHGHHWRYWAPWVGTYLYFDSYDACYRSCRSRGYSRAYCADRCGL